MDADRLRQRQLQTETQEHRHMNRMLAQLGQIVMGALILGIFSAIALTLLAM